MQIVINIHEKDYLSIKNGHIPFCILDSIMNGTPLPKGHGRLIDANALKQVYETTEDAEVCEWTLYGVTSEIDDAETIIEADKAESEG